ncbi:hypothetical protein LUZ60_002406 [Juncus effusus]|nr:hypothetical protein LUZ60_002406 [Juncus effusus]
MVNVFSNKIKRDNIAAGDHIYSHRLLKSYAHHGIYIGNNKVIHFTGGNNNNEADGLVHGMFPGAGSSAGPANNIFRYSSKPEEAKDCEECFKYHEGKPVEGVILSCLDCFLDGGSLYLFAYSVSKKFFYAKIRGGTCTLAPSDPLDQVIHRAQYLLDHGFGDYNLLKHNCEDFALYCKTGLAPKSPGGPAISGQAICFGASKMSSRGSSTANLISSINVYFDVTWL